jgi:alginate O-acetyltransferase complex protein AlgI
LQVFSLLFLPAVLGAHYLSAERPVLREAILILASLLFYAWWDARFVPLLIGQTIATWLIAEAYLRFRDRHLPRFDREPRQVQGEVQAPLPARLG